MNAAASGPLVAAVLGIATVVLLITWAKFHPFLALILGTAVLGVAAAVSPAAIVGSFVTGFGNTMGAVGLLIALGAMIGKLLADSGGADTIVDRIVATVGAGRMPWGMALIAAILGLPLFFEVGVILLVPVVILVARKLDLSLMKIGIPALAGLSILHGFVPPHPGPLVAVDSLKADMGMVLIFGLIVAVPTLVVAGPVLARFVDQWVTVRADAAPGGPDATLVEARRRSGRTRRPSFGAALVSITLPVVLMLARAIAELTMDERSAVRGFLEFVGTPFVALLAALLVALVLLGYGSGMSRVDVQKAIGSGLPGIGGILLIVAAGGGLKQMLVDAGVANVIADLAKGAGLSPLILGWLVAVAIRLATGSATVATITAAGIVSPLSVGLDRPQVALLVLAIGSGSLFFSHVNDAGFWLVKEYFGLTVGQTIKSWSVMETVISIVGLLFVLLLSRIV